MGMTTTPAKALTAPQSRMLATLVRNGGEMNAYAGQAGFNCHSVAPLVRLGLVERVASCDNCLRRPTDKHAAACTQPLTGQKGGQQCYDRIRVTAAGREHLIASTTPTAVPAAVEPIAKGTMMTTTTGRLVEVISEPSLHLGRPSVLIRYNPGSAKPEPGRWALIAKLTPVVEPVEPIEAEIADLIEEVKKITRPAMSAADLYGRYVWTCDTCGHELVAWAVRKDGKLIRPAEVCNRNGLRTPNRCPGAYSLTGPYER